MSTKYTKESLLTLIQELLPTDKKITATSRYIEDLGLDSLEMVDLIMEFEDKFGIELPEEEAEKMLSVADSIEYILAKEAVDA
jgi:acyl carrier protein